MPSTSPRPASRLHRRLIALRLRLQLRRRSRLRFLVSSLLLTACGGGESAPAREITGHMFTNEASGVAIELPPMWAGRYRTTDSVTAPAQGLERELTLRMVKADSSVVAEPLLVVRVFANSGWDAVPAESSATWWGTVIAKDAARTLAVKPAAANPLTPGTADALAYDSLMLAVLQREIKANLRAPGR